MHLLRSIFMFKATSIFIDRLFFAKVNNITIIEFCSKYNTCLIKANIILIYSICMLEENTFSLLLWYMKHNCSFNAESYFFIYIKHMILNHFEDTHSFFIYIKHILSTFWWYTHLNNQAVLFLTIQFSISQQS